MSDRTTVEAHHDLNASKSTQLFEGIARASIRFRWLVLMLWIVLPIAAASGLPSLSSVTQANNSEFLSASSPSQQAAALAVPFQGKQASSTATMVASRTGGPLTAADNAAIDRAEQAVARARGVTLVRDQGTSKDGEARLALVATSTARFGTSGTAVVDAIRHQMTTVQAPPGLTFHLTGPLAQAADANSASAHSGGNIRMFVLLFVIVLLFLVFRSLLAPLVTLLPAVLSLLLAGPLIAEAANAGVPVSSVTGELLTVLLIGAGTDYGLFLVFRVREEIRRGSTPRDAIVTAMGRVGLSITFSATTVIAALVSLLLASFGLYRGLGPALAIGLAVMLLAALTLLPALLGIFGRAVFWPSHPSAGERTASLVGSVATRVVHHPVPILIAGIVLFGSLSAGLVGYKIGGFTNSAPAGTDSAQGAAVIAAHFRSAANSSDQFLLRFDTPIWYHLEVVSESQNRLVASSDLRAVTGPLDPNGTSLSAAQLSSLHTQLGPAAELPAVPPPGRTVPTSVYDAYRSTAQFISPDGRTIQFYAVPAAGAVGTNAALQAVPAMRSTLATVARAVGAQANGLAGTDSASYDVSHTATTDLTGVLPVVLVIIAGLLALLLLSLVAPWYLIITVGLSYLASLGFAMIVFVHLGGESGLNFVLPFLLFVFAMALGEDYNILLMSQIREEAHSHRDLRDALTRAIGATGGTITSAGLILGGSFAVLALVAGSEQARQLGFTIAFAVLLDTFFVRTLLVPSIAVLLGRCNWWPSKLSYIRVRLSWSDRDQAAAGMTPPA
jgi:RND superfamily putative drug exporter